MGLKGNHLVALDQPLAYALVSLVLRKQRYAAGLHLFPDAEGRSTGLAGARYLILYLFEGPVESMVGVRQLGDPLGPGAGEDQVYLLPGLLEFVGGRQSVGDPRSVGVRLRVRHYH